jgi:hypothetical protein
MQRLPPYRDYEEGGGWVKWVLLGVLIAVVDGVLIWMLWTGQILGY